MKVCWDDIGRSPIAGTYFVGDINIVVREADIGVWREHPFAVFNTTWYRRGQMIGAKALADWTEPPGELSPPSAETKEASPK